MKMYTVYYSHTNKKMHTHTHIHTTISLSKMHAMKSLETVDPDRK